MKHKLSQYICVALMVLLVVIGAVLPAAADGGPNSDSGEASVSGNYNFEYSFSSTYYGSLTEERPKVSTDGAAASATFDATNNQFIISATSSAGINKLGSSRDYSAQNVSTECTITNKSGYTLLINYTYSVSGGALNGSDLAAGTSTLTWLPGVSIDFGVITTVTDWTAGSSTATATFKINSCSVVTTYDLSVYPTRFGSYTYTVGDASDTLEATDTAYVGTAADTDTLVLTVPTLNEAYAEDYRCGYRRVC